MARQFQGYARGRGFSSRNPGSAAVSRIQEQGNKTISGLRQQLQSKRQQDQQYIADLDSNFRRGEQIKDEIKSFEDKAFNLKMANVKRNQNQHLENIKTEAQNQADTYKQLAEFSTTLGQTVVDVKSAVETAQKKAEFATFELGLANPPTAAEKDVEDALRKGDAASANRLKTAVTQDGLPMATAQQAMAQSPYKQLKNTDARIQAATQEVVSTASLTNYGPEFIHGILEKYNLYGVRPSRLYDLAQTYSKTRAAFDQSKSKQLAVDTSAQSLNTAKANFFNARTPENLNNLIQTAKEHTEDGRSFVGLTKANDILYDALRNEKVTNEDIQVFFETPILDANGEPTGRTYGEQFKDTRNVDLLNKREQDRIQSVKDRNDVFKAEQLDNYLKVDAELDRQAEQGPVDFNSFKMEIDDVSMSTDQRNKTLEKLYEISTQRFQNKPLLAEIDRLRSNGQDYTDVAKRLKGRDRYKYLNLASQEIKERKEAGINDASDRRQIKDALIKALKQQNIGADKDPSLQPALEDAMIDIGRDTVNNPQGASTLAGSRKLAVEVKLQEIKAGIGKYEVKGMGKGNDNQTTNYFSYYSPGGKYFTNVVKQNPSQLMSSVRNRPDVRKDTFLTSQENLTGIYNSIKNNEPYQLEYGLQQINKAYPDTLQLQLNKFAIQNNLPTVTVPLTQNQFLAARENDPRVKQFAQKMDTIQEEILFPVIADASIKMSQTFMNGPVAVKQNYFQMKAQGGPADMQSGKQYFEGMGFPSRGAAYLAGNIMQESSWNGMRSWGPVKNDGTKRNGGLISWASWANDPARLGAAEAFLGKPIDQATHSEQLEYMEHEMRTRYREAYDIFMNPNASTPDLIKASKMYWGYGHEGKRYKFAEELL